MTVPALLSLSRNYESTALFLDRIRKSIIESHGNSINRMPSGSSSGLNRHSRRSPLVINGYFDYTKIEQITSEVALIIASEYDCARRNGMWMPGAVDFQKWSPEVRWMLDNIGFLEMVGVHTPGPTYLDGKDWRILRFRSSDQTDGEEVDRLLHELGVAEAVENPELYEAIIEALANTRHHAYPTHHTFAAPHFPGWWLTGFVDKGARRLRINAFDRGLGIPGTLHSWQKYSLFQRGWRQLFRTEPDPRDTSHDGDAIALAMEVGRSSTGEAYRGRGLPAIEAVLDLCLTGSLAIYSRCGGYYREKGSEPRPFNRNDPIRGTLITWDLRF